MLDLLPFTESNQHMLLHRIKAFDPIGQWFDHLWRQRRGEFVGGIECDLPLTKIHRTVNFKVIVMAAI